MTTPAGTSLSDWIDSLDPFLREAARGYLRGLLEPIPVHKSLTTAEHDLREELLRQVKSSPSADAPVPIPVVVMVTFFLAVATPGIGPIPPALITASIVGIVTVGLLVGLWSFKLRESRQRSGKTRLNAILDAVLPDSLSCVAQTRTERAYVDAVRALLPAQTPIEEYLSTELCREQMAQLNALLDSGRRLDTVWAEIAAALANASPETLRSEANSLRGRVERATDPGTRAAFAQSLALCEERLHRAESLDRLTERIEAEQELVYQAFRAAQSSIASLRVSPTAAGIDSTTELGPVAEVAETIGRQTRAVEAAVQELGIRR